LDHIQTSFKRRDKSLVGIILRVSEKLTGAHGKSGKPDNPDR